ncbi:MAG: outer membrane lipid asymmetry maintenance protein MlaD [Alphaproteobacteria bacterium]|nr:outer membrane lipid asymmetry maintenance protein MlaD [Alphaproteobacteria bacterium]
MHNDTVESLIGAVVIAVAVLFVVFAYRATGATNMSGYELTAKMPRVDGIAVGTDIRLSGIKVGTVSAMTLDANYLVTVHMDIHSDVKVPDDSSLVVTSSGLLGSSYLSISPGGSDKMLPPGGVIRNTQGSIDMMGLLSRFVGSSTSSGTNNNTGPTPATPKP